MRKDNPNFWKTHIAAMITGAALGAGVTYMTSLESSQKQEAEISTLRREVAARLAEKEKLESELETLRAHRQNDVRVVRRLESENRKMNMWMEWLLGQEEELMAEKEQVEALIESEGQADPLAGIPEDFEIPDEVGARIAELDRQGCRVEAIINSQIRFTSKTDCSTQFMRLENGPERDYYGRESFGRELTDSEEVLVSALEERQYMDVVDNVNTDDLRREVKDGIERTEASQEVADFFEELVRGVEVYQKDPNNFEAKCRVLIAFMQLEDLHRDFPDPEVFFQGNVSLSMFMEAIEEGGMGLDDTNDLDRCIEFLPPDKR